MNFEPLVSHRQKGKTGHRSEHYDTQRKVDTEMDIMTQKKLYIYISEHCDKEKTVEPEVNTVTQTEKKVDTEVNTANDQERGM